MYQDKRVWGKSVNGNILAANKQICSADWRVEGKEETFHRIYYVYKGKVIYEYEERVVRLKTNHLYIFPPNKPYKMKHNPHHPFEVMWFHLDYAFPLVEDIFEVNIKTDSTEQKLIHALEGVISEEQIVGEKIFDALLTLLQIKYGIKKELFPDVEKIVKYINEHIHENINNEELAKVAGYNTNYMIKRFKKHVGLSPRQYIIQTRMNYARKYLINGNSVRQTACLLGYDDANLLSRDFKKYYHKPPSYYIGYKVP